MYITYVDESERSGRYYFVGALVVDPVGLAIIESALDRICTSLAAKIPIVSPAIELHGYEVFHGSEDWAQVPPRLRISVTRQVIDAIASANPKFIIAGLDRNGMAPGGPIHEQTLMATLALVEQKVLLPNGNKSLVIADDHHAAENSRRQFQLSRIEGASTKSLTSFVDTIYFGPSDHSRLLRAADMVTFIMARSLTKAETNSKSGDMMLEFVASIMEFTAQVDFPG